MGTSSSGAACVVYNPEAGTSERIEEIRQGGSSGVPLVLCATDAEGDASRHAQQAARDGARAVVAAGGDGTIREVVSGLMEARDAAPDRPLPDLLIVPMGTGNDLARTLDLPEATADLLGLLQTGVRRRLDVLRWRLSPTGGAAAVEGWSVNVIAGGFAAKLKRALTPEVKKFWGPLAYARAAFSSMDEVENPHTLTFSIDGGEAQTIEAINVIVANARYAGGGMEVAPMADPSDGLLDLVIITPGGLLDLAEVTARLLMGEVDESEHTFTATARRLRLSAEPAIPFNIDGDPVGKGTLEVEVVPAAVQVLVPAAAEQAEAQPEAVTAP